METEIRREDIVCVDPSTSYRLETGWPLLDVGMLRGMCSKELFDALWELGNNESVKVKIHLELAEDE